jgi:indole-3-glycerol phosphate synthase
VHNPEELSLLCLDPLLIGINNRNLHDFTTHLETTLRLRPLIPSKICVVSESGIRSPADVTCLAKAGVDAILVGEALVTAPDTGAQVRSLAGQTAGVPQR